jgi:phospholipase C
MIQINRRNFLRSAVGAATLAAFPPSIQRALAIPANNATGTIRDIEHVIILMQENRSFDHYHGTLAGVRGYSDRLTIPMASGDPVWLQRAGNGSVIQPYHLDSSQGKALRGSLPHSWNDQQNAWNHGRMTGWPVAKGNASMGYLEDVEHEMQFHRALANAFTVCDNYYTSCFTGTFPNRTFLWSGTNGANVSDHVVNSNASWGYTVTGGTIQPSANGLTWATYPERLEAAGVSWKVYQNPSNNSNNNQLGAFASFRAAVERLNAQGYPVSTAYSPELAALEPLIKGVGNTLPDPINLTAFGEDVAAGRLPQVSWIVAPAAYSEHPGGGTPEQGGWYIQKILNYLTAYPEIWSKTAIILNYDENDGYFDHLPPPVPPSPNGDGSYAGKSTVDVSREYFTMTHFPFDSDQSLGPDGRPFGACVRVPTLIISPWSVGGWVNSQVFDHTSTLRFLEQRFGIPEPNISPWRRSVFGDMTSCFDFKTPNDAFPTIVTLPADKTAIDALSSSQNSAAAVPIPAAGSVPLPTQQRVARPSRTLPYHLHTSANLDTASGQVWLTFSNTGEQGAVFHVYDRYNLDRIPRRYTVESGKMISDVWDPAANAAPNAGKYSLWVLGPNGFHRLFEGDTAQAASGSNLEVRVCYEPAQNSVALTIMNLGSQPANVSIAANAYRSDGPWTYSVEAGKQIEPSWKLDRSHGWYDFTLTMADGYARRFAGRLENGQDSTSDPEMGVAS